MKYNLKALVWDISNLKNPPNGFKFPNSIVYDEGKEVIDDQSHGQSNNSMSFPRNEGSDSDEKDSENDPSVAADRDSLPVVRSLFKSSIPVSDPDACDPDVSVCDDSPISSVPVAPKAFMSLIKDIDSNNFT